MIMELIKPFWVAIVKYSVIIGSILLILLRVKKSGKDLKEYQDANTTLEAMRERDKIAGEVSNYSDDKLNSVYEKYIKRD